MRQLSHPDFEDVSLTTILAALGDPTRLAIVATLARSRSEVAWSDLEFDVHKATLSHHVKTLRLAGLISHRKEGTRCFLSLRKDIDKAYPGLLKAVMRAAARDG